ncbi:MAG TPA: ABC transporter permease [Gemmatimonadaceae bacterium]|nr:ABC transporter permease [Gemmatimonadaceae bacterium]
MTELEALLEASVRTATPLALAALGETVAERAGVVNIGLEGVILAGAFGALVGASTGTLGGVAVAILAGVATAAVFAAFAVGARADQIITGMAVTLLSVGVTGTLYRSIYGASGAALTIPTVGPVSIPLLSQLPIVGRAAFEQPPFTYLAYVLVPAVWWWMYRTHGGLALRAIGEAPEAARAVGIHERRVRAGAVLFGGALGGVSGASLVLAQSGTFAEGMSAGRGFIAIAIVVLGRWHPVGVGIAALVFGLVSALQFFFQTMGWRAPYQLFLLLPYLLTLVLLGMRRSRGAAPLALGQP